MSGAAIAEGVAALAGPVAALRLALGGCSVALWKVAFVVVVYRGVVKARSIGFALVSFEWIRCLSVFGCFVFTLLSMAVLISLPQLLPPT